MLLILLSVLKVSCTEVKKLLNVFAATSRSKIGLPPSSLIKLVQALADVPVKSCGVCQRCFGLLLLLMESEYDFAFEFRIKASTLFLQRAYWVSFLLFRNWLLVFIAVKISALIQSGRFCRLTFLFFWGPWADKTEKCLRFKKSVFLLLRFCWKISFKNLKNFTPKQCLNRSFKQMQFGQYLYLV